MTNDEILKVVQGETEGKTIMVRGLISGRIIDSEYWHEKSTDKPWDFTNRAYKVKPMTIEDFIEKQQRENADTDSAWNRGYLAACTDIKRVLKELEK